MIDFTKPIIDNEGFEAKYGCECPAGGHVVFVKRQDWSPRIVDDDGFMLGDIHKVDRCILQKPVDPTKDGNAQDATFNAAIFIRRMRHGVAMIIASPVVGAGAILPDGTLEKIDAMIDEAEAMRAAGVVR